MKLAAVVALGLVATAGLAAKGTTVKLVVSGGDLRAPTEITKDVQFANPWGDAFVHSWIPIPRPRPSGNGTVSSSTKSSATATSR
jgi:hypothetical protein